MKYMIGWANGITLTFVICMTLITQHLLSNISNDLTTLQDLEHLWQKPKSISNKVNKVDQFEHCEMKMLRFETTTLSSWLTIFFESHPFLQQSLQFQWPSVWHLPVHIYIHMGSRVLQRYSTLQISL